jgi:hypothetical protein
MTYRCHTAFGHALPSADNCFHKNTLSSSIRDPKLSVAMSSRALQSRYLPSRRGGVIQPRVVSRPSSACGHGQDSQLQMTNFFICDPTKGFSLNEQNSQNCLRLSEKYRTGSKYYQIHFKEFYLFVYFRDSWLSQQKKKKYWLVDIAVMSCHVVQLQGLAIAVGCSIANHTDMQTIRTAQLFRGSCTVCGPSAIRLRCERPEYTGCLAKKVKMSGRISLRYYCVVVQYIF